MQSEPHDPTTASWPASQRKAMRQDLWESQHAVLHNEVDAFELEFARWAQIPRCIGVAHHSLAFRPMIRSLKIGPGDKVIVPSYGGETAATGVLAAGAGIVFGDIDPVSLTLSPEAVEGIMRSTRGKTVKAVIAVHRHGHPADLLQLNAVAEQHGIVLLEDCEDAFGARCGDQLVGSVGRAALFAFPTRRGDGILGDVGVITTSDTVTADKLNGTTDYGWRRSYKTARWNGGFRLDGFQGALLRLKLQGLDQLIVRRHHLAALLTEELAELPWLSLSSTKAGQQHAHSSFVIRTYAKEELLSHLERLGKVVADFDSCPLHQQADFARFAAESPELPVTEQAALETLALPLQPGLTEGKVRSLCEAIRLFQ